MNDREFTSEDVASGYPGYVMPLSVQFSPDGERLTYLFPDETGRRTLQCIDIATQAHTAREAEKYVPYKLLDPSAAAASGSLSLAEQLRRERMRLFTSGVSSYEWTHSGDTQWILVPLGNKLYLYREDKNNNNNNNNNSSSSEERERERVRLIYDGSLGAPIDAHLSPNGNAVAFVLNHNLYLQQIPPLPTDNHTNSPPFPAEPPLPAPVQLTHEGQESKGLSYGLADYVAQEEMSRYRGFWWSPDSASLLLCVCDESAVPQYEIAHQGKDSPAERETHRYPFAGARNALVRLAVLSVGQYTHAHTHAHTEGSEITNAAAEDEVLITQRVKDTLSLTDERECVAETETQKETESESELRFLSLCDERDPRFHCAHIHREGERETYVARAGWWPDGSVMIQIQNREQNVLQLLRIDPHTHRRTVLLEETSRSFVNLHDLLHPLSLSFRPHTHTRTHTQSSPTEPVPLPHNEGDFCFVWGSERSGFSQLYLYQYNSASDCGVSLCEAYDALPLSTGGDWVVESIDAVDEQRGVLYFSGNYAAPTERHLCVASLTLSQTLAQTRFARLTESAGWHVCAVSASQCVFADTYCDLHTPVCMSLYEFSLSPPLSHKHLLENETNPHTTLSSPVASVRCLKTVIDTRTVDMRFVRDPPLCESLSRAAPTLHTIPCADDPHTHLVCAVYLPQGLSLDMYLHAHREREAMPTHSHTHSADHTTLTHNSAQDDSSSLTQQEYTTQRTHTHTTRSLPAFPAVCALYGGPHVQYVRSHWTLTADLRAQRLTQRGCVVLKCDNRGSARRGLAFESAIHRCVGHTELSDQRRCVEYFQRIGLIHKEVSESDDVCESETSCVRNVSDVRESSVVCSPPAVTARKRVGGESSHSHSARERGDNVRASRVGVVGWSYGGYLSALSLCTHSDLFCCAVAGAPVTSWDGYDTHYTERYMGLPQENVQGYEQSSVLSHVSKMRGRLLLIHGLIDENVHFRHTARLINALIAARKRYELVLFPCERHAPHKLGDRVYLEDILHDFLMENLRPAPFDARAFFADSVSSVSTVSVSQIVVN